MTTLAEQQMAKTGLDRTVSSVYTNIAAMLAICSVSGSHVANAASIQITFPSAVEPTCNTLRQEFELDAVLLRELVSTAEWMIGSQASPDRDTKAALYEDRWEQYI